MSGPRALPVWNPGAKYRSVQPMRIATFTNTWDTEPTHHELTWAEYIAASAEHEYIEPVRGRFGGKLQCPMLSPAEFRDGGMRVDADVVRVHFLMLDFDGLTDAVAEHVFALASRYAHFAYTSWSHVEKPNRFRIAFPLTRPVDVSEWDAFWSRAYGHFECLADEKCCNASRAYFRITITRPKRRGRVMNA